MRFSAELGGFSGHRHALRRLSQVRRPVHAPRQVVHRRLIEVPVCPEQPAPTAFLFVGTFPVRECRAQRNSFDRSCGIPSVPRYDGAEERSAHGASQPNWVYVVPLNSRAGAHDVARVAAALSSTGVRCAPVPQSPPSPTHDVAVDATSRRPRARRRIRATVLPPPPVAIETGGPDGGGARASGSGVLQVVRVSEGGFEPPPPVKGTRPST